MKAFELRILGLIRGCFTVRNKALDWRNNYIQKQRKVKNLDYEITEVELTENNKHPQDVEIDPRFSYYETI